MHKGIAFAGNLIVDRVKMISRLPQRSELAAIQKIGRSTGGVCNSALCTALLDPALPVSVFGVAGNDSDGDFILDEFARHGIHTEGILRRGATGFTDVYEETETNCRTLLHFGGANNAFDVDDIDYSQLRQRAFHLGYLLLLKALDQPDAAYGSRAGRMLHYAQQAGCSTSADVISEDSQRYAQLVRPTLRYLDNLIINELEASRITGIPLTDARGVVLEGSMPTALERLFDLGVSHWAVIHTPGGAWGMDSLGHTAYEPGKHLPPGFIKGTVGAGDAFCAGALLADGRGASIAEALRWGNAVAICSLKSDTANGAMTTIENALAEYAQY